MAAAGCAKMPCYMIWLNLTAKNAQWQFCIIIGTYKISNAVLGI
jgi:hypothetical protein